MSSSQELYNHLNEKLRCAKQAWRFPLATGLCVLPDFQATLSDLKLLPVAISITLNSNV